MKTKQCVSCGLDIPPPNRGRKACEDCVVKSMNGKPITIERGFEVEWCEKVRLFDDGSFDHDSAEYSCKDFVSEKDAREFAKSKTELDIFGSVRVTAFTLERLHEDNAWHKHKEYSADSFYIDRE